MTLRLILASASPARTKLLTEAGIAHTVTVSDVDEDAVTAAHGSPSPYDTAQLLARAKAEAVAALPEARGALVIGCDTDVVLDGKALGKPADATEARAYLDRMAGRAHTVMSGLVVLDGGEERSGLEATTVVFKPLSDAEKERYVAFGEWRDRSGGYAIQTLGSTLVERLEGSVSNVVGLPVGLLLELAPQVFTQA